jgi:hypothetical protein
LIDGSAFIDVALSSISIESGNDIFVTENGFIGVIEKEALEDS